jgi:hypothetical protein
MLVDMPSAIAYDQVDIEESRATRPSSRWSLLRRLRRAVQPSRRLDALSGLDDIRAVLEQARETVAAGWVQGRWYAVNRSAGGGPSRQHGGADSATENVVGACVVGAIALTVRQRYARAELAVDAGPAIDYVWDAMQDAGGLDMPAAAGRAWPREARLARMRDLARWNDAAGRTKAEILGVLDDAISRVIMSAMRQHVASSR